MNKLHVIKIGGNIINDKKALNAFLDDFAAINEPKILVHGGGTIATDLSEKLNIKPSFSEGRRITSAEDLEIVTMVYAGLLNKNITAALQAKGCNAIGLSGADANTVITKKREVQTINYGLVGDVEAVDAFVINNFLIAGITPVYCAITHDGQGQLLNTNADTMAAEIAIAMGSAYEVKLIYCFEKAGVLKDVNDHNSVISKINWNSYQALKKEKVIVNGMLPKLENCFHALNNNVKQVLIGSSEVLKHNKLCTTLTLK